MKPTNMDDLVKKAEDAYAKRQVLEDKIRVAQARMAQRSPLEILRDAKK
jgi:hypothetical protein